MKTTVINDVSHEDAQLIVQNHLRPTINKLIRKAHKEGSRGRRAYAELHLSEPLLDAAIRLKDEFETEVRVLVPDVWEVRFAYTVNHYAPGFIMIDLKVPKPSEGIEG